VPENDYRKLEGEFCYMLKETETSDNTKYFICVFTFDSAPVDTELLFNKIYSDDDPGLKDL